MGEYLSPGVYVEEMPGSQPVQPAGTSTAAFVGFAEKGPLNEPIFITNYSEYVATFGDVCEFGTDSQAYLPYIVRQFFDNGGGRCYVVRVASANASLARLISDYNLDNGETVADIADVTAKSFTVQESGTDSGSITVAPAYKGSWAAKYRVKLLDTIENEQMRGTDPLPNDLSTFRIQIIKAGEKKNKNGEIETDTDGNVVSDVIVEEFDNLSLNPLSKDFISTQINEVSKYIEVTATGGSTTATVSTIPANLLRFYADDTVGLDGLTDIDSADFTDPKKGVRALEIIDEVNMIAVPDAHQLANKDKKLAALTDAQTYVYNRADCMFITESLLGEKDDITKSTSSRQSLASKNTAYYTPWVKVINKVTGTKMDLPPCGAMAGIYARTDRNRGVFKAPAGTMDGGVNGIVGLERPINKAKQSQLNPIGINCIREMPNVGNVVWGTRTTSPDAQWRYVPVRRLILFIEKSLEKAAQSSVFEPNDPKLWSRLKRDFSGFLRGIWKEGGLFGASEDQAFFVKIDDENNPQSSRDAGKLIINIGVAPVKPAEFVILRIEQTQNA